MLDHSMAMMASEGTFRVDAKLGTLSVEKHQASPTWSGDGIGTGSSWSTASSDPRWRML